MLNIILEHQGALLMGQVLHAAQIENKKMAAALKSLQSKYETKQQKDRGRQGGGHNRWKQTSGLCHHKHLYGGTN